MTNTKRKPNPEVGEEVRSVQVGVMLEPSLAGRLDDLRRALKDMPTRSTLCRALIAEGLDRAAKKAK